MNTQMNPTDAEIAGKLDGMECGGVQVIENTANNDVWVSVEALHVTDDAVVHFTPSDLLAFCHAVVERVDGEPIVMNTPRYSPAPRTFFTVEETREWILGELIYDGNGNEPEMFKEKNRHTRFLAGYLDDKESGLAATTARHRNDGK